LDIFSRKIAGWLIAEREEAELAELLIAESCAREGIAPQQLTLHADRGAPMTSKSVAELLIDLGVARSHSRPRMSNDNPYSESQFKIMKYGPWYPERFASIEEARARMGAFVRRCRRGSQRRRLSSTAFTWRATSALALMPCASRR